MKKNFAILFVLLAIAFRGFAQDTITGMVNRIAAPYFEQNVCDTRFALSAGDETYYVMVDNYWPNPYLEDLVIHYDTIPIGNEIEVVGTIMEMEDGNGERFSVINIQKLFNAVYSYGTGFIDWFSQFAMINCTASPYNWCYIAINGELQSEPPIVFNELTLGDGRYTMIGITEIWPDYDYPILELTHAIPYAIETTAMGVVMENDELCLVTPCGEKKYLSWSDNDGTHYLTNEDKLHDNRFFNTVWGDNVSSTINGFANTHYDLFGAPFETFETLFMETTGERNLVGPVLYVGNPSTSSAPPIGMSCAIIDNHDEYLVENSQQWNYSQTQCIIENDTLPYNMEVKGHFTTTHMFLGNGITPYMKVFFDSIRVNTFGTRTVSGILTQQTYNNYQYEPFFSIVSDDGDDYYIGTGPFIDAISGCLSIGQNNVFVGDHFSAIGEIGRFYGLLAASPVYVLDVHNTININEVSNITGLSEVSRKDIQVFPNPSNGIIEIVSEKPIESISVYDIMGRMIVNKTNCSFNNTLDLTDHKGLVLLYIIFQDGHKTIEKVILK